MGTATQKATHPHLARVKAGTPQWLNDELRKDFTKAVAEYTKESVKLGSNADSAGYDVTSIMLKIVNDIRAEQAPPADAPKSLDDMFGDDDI